MTKNSCEKSSCLSHLKSKLREEKKLQLGHLEAESLFLDQKNNDPFHILRKTGQGNENDFHKVPYFIQLVKKQLSTMGGVLWGMALIVFKKLIVHEWVRWRGREAGAQRARWSSHLVLIHDFLKKNQSQQVYSGNRVLGLNGLKAIYICPWEVDILAKCDCKRQWNGFSCRSKADSEDISNRKCSCGSGFAKYRWSWQLHSMSMESLS